MIRLAAAVAVALCLAPSWLHAQGTQLTVKTASADVHKAPTTASPVIGQAPRGAVLEVTRELGDWVKISWPDAQDGVAYVRLSTGSIVGGATTTASAEAGVTSSPALSQSASPTMAGMPADASASTTDSVPTSAPYVAPLNHIVGLGGRVGGSTPSFGATARLWSRQRLGVQVEVSRSSITSVEAPGRLTSVQFAPSLIYSLPDSLTDYVWVRPYLGGGPTFYRSTLSSGIPGVSGSLPENSLGFATFGGGEVTFSSVPRFALSVDVGYSWSPTAFTVYDLGGLGFSVSGHWYVK
jgi:hypothetical protein